MSAEQDRQVAAGPSLRKAALLYTVGRFGLFLLVALLVYVGTGAAGDQLNGLPLALVAALLSSVVGYVIFAPQRRQLADALAARRQAKTEQIVARRARLDETGPG